jgi:hypothetical protein
LRSKPPTSISGQPTAPAFTPVIDVTPTIIIDVTPTPPKTDSHMMTLFYVILARITQNNVILARITLFWPE